MRDSLVNDIKGAAFVQEWSREQAAGAKELARLKEEAFRNAMSQAEGVVIPLMHRSRS